MHERLHGVPVFAALAQGKLGRASYTGLLGRLYGFHAPMEQAVAAALDNEAYGLDPQSWRRAHLLRNDLLAMGYGSADIGHLPAIAATPALSRAAAMGCLYVMEGSTLGGRHLARQLDTMLPGDAGRQFLLGSTQPGHVRWSEVCTALDACGADEQRLGEMTRSALRTFECFDTWFAEFAPV